MITDPELLLKSMGAKTNRRKIMLFVLGVKRRLHLPDGTVTKRVPMLTDCPPTTTYCTDIGWTAPRPDQIERCLQFWIENEYSPDVFRWLEGDEPALEIEPPSNTMYRPSHDIDDNDHAPDPAPDHAPDPAPDPDHKEN